jgi:hypothetical protein
VNDILESIQARRAAQIDQAVEFLDTIASHKPAGQSHSALVWECARLREVAEQLTDILGDVFVFPPDPGSDQERERDELLAEVPVSCRREGALPDDEAAGVATMLANAATAPIVRGWLRAARREAQS